MFVLGIKSTRKKDCTSGFTLIEILVSLAIIAIAFVAILKSTALVQDSLISSKTKNLAAMLGAQKMAEIENNGLNNIKQWNGKFEANNNFKWKIKEEPTSQEQLRRIKLIISDLSEQKEILSFERIIFIPPNS